MRQRFTPTLRISISLVLFTLSLVLVAGTFGLIPDERQFKLKARANVAESLAIQLSSVAGQNDFSAVKETIDLVVERNPDVLSVAVRRKNGSVLVGSREHSKHWVPPQDGHSTSTHVQVPLYSGKQFWGLVECPSGRYLPSSKSSECPCHS